MPTHTSTRRLVRASVRAVARLLLLALALLVAACLTVLVVLPRASHGVALTVLTGSMTPEIPVGSVVVVRPVDPRTLEVGDVATYQLEEGEKAFVTHRVRKILHTDDGLAFRFKGDANRGADPQPIPAGAVRGKVWIHVPYLGGIRDALHGKGGVTLFGMLLLAGYAISQVSAGLRERRAPARGDRLTRVVFDAPLLYAELPRAAGGPSPEELARTWSGVVVRRDQGSFAVLCRPAGDGLEAAREVLAAHDPLRLVVLDHAAVDGAADASADDHHPSTQERVHADADT